MKRPRDFSPPGLDDASYPSSGRHQITKRMKTMSVRENYESTNIGSSINDCSGGLSLVTKSDDDISLAEESQTTPTAFPHHSSFIHPTHPTHQYRQQQQQQSLQLQQQQLQCRIRHHQAPPAAVAARTDDRSGTTNSMARGPSYATDYQPINSILGNLHLARQQQQQRRRQLALQLSHGQAQARNYPGMVPQQQQQQPQQHHQRHHANYRSIPTADNNNALSSRDNRPRRKTVSLRVNSNLY
eukprot:CAMPEP_0201260832 /NCGR_PEP_ID=MMETSP0853-20130426/5087_1 /ASSEMBLY_ACC=CAM_ASM_000640 /TAXON_ID=183588 /ORGANISM="Pseudo-nitzschia fraudulenta, Strain WWA7" /LENGTH=241 /DNA_ID=CAMNT_0047563589 /DNA_START=157 /DNA_END=882 /DNA_ORIENTATION=-